MKREDLDLKLKEALNTAAENIVPPEDMFDRIEKRIESCEYKEEKNMKMNFKFKVAVVAAAICAFSPAASFINVMK